MSKYTRKAYEEYLNELGDSICEEAFIMGGKKRHGKYGTAQRKYDPTAFEVGFKEWKREHTGSI